MKVLYATLLVLAVFASVQARFAVKQFTPTPKCTVCEYLVDSVYDTMTDAELFAASGLQDKCAAFGVPKDLCEDSFNALVKPIRAAKDSGVAPQLACAHSGACPAKRDAAVLPFDPIRGDLLNGKFCGICEIFVTVIQNYLDAAQSRDTVKATLLSFCNDLASPTNTLCSLAVEMYLPKIINSLENQNLPNLICTELKLCTAN